ncbi:MAG: selenoneine biosynthesis selenosugar synthase SenB [Acidimicrobiales bacterium]
MHVVIVTPVRPGASSGNDVTASRWQRRLAELGHEVEVVKLTAADGEGFRTDGPDVAPTADLLVVLHARRCAAAVAASRTAHPRRPVVVGLAGTDLYRDLPDDLDAFAAVQAADRLVVLQSLAIERLRDLDPTLAAKSHVVHQSVEAPVPARNVHPGSFDVVVLAHLREVKDPLMAARAARRLPTDSQVQVRHAGGAHDDAWAVAARAEQADNPRYHWLGELDRDAARELLASASVLACTSRLEGGANVVSEAIATGVPVVGTAIDGNRGLLGSDYPGLVAPADDEALAVLLRRLETDPAALAELQRLVDQRRPLTDPAHERAQWEGVLTGLGR